MYKQIYKQKYKQKYIHTNANMHTDTNIYTHATHKLPQGADLLGSGDGAECAADEGGPTAVAGGARQATRTPPPSPA
jgi:hypothetical protein